jgi:hypothetical protein
MRTALLLSVVLCATGCESIEYGIKERFGIEKRDIMVARVQDAIAAQEAAKVQFQSALAEFSALVGFDGGDLEDLYAELKDSLAGSERRAAAVTSRVDDVERVSDALFGEWRDELNDYSSAELRRASERQLRATKSKYEQLMRSMRSAEARMAPVLAAFRDQVLYLKHNLNAQAVAALKGELKSIESDVARLIREMETAISRSQGFIRDLESNG